jgi:hypothetical protein
MNKPTPKQMIPKCQPNPTPPPQSYYDNDYTSLEMYGQGFRDGFNMAIALIQSGTWTPPMPEPTPEPTPTPVEGE